MILAISYVNSTPSFEQKTLLFSSTLIFDKLVQFINKLSSICIISLFIVKLLILLQSFRDSFFKSVITGDGASLS